MTEINELIGWAENGINKADNRKIPTEYIPIVGYLGAIACSLLARTKIINRKICLDCEGTGFGKPTEAGKNTHGLTIRKETHCPTCKGRGRVE